jgi:hypothetical protein
MATESRRTRAGGATLGYGIVLLGAALFVVSCFLPYQGFPVSFPDQTASLYDLLTIGPGSDLGSLLQLFGGVTPVAVVAIVALAGGERRAVLPSLLVGAVLAWSLTWGGFLLNQGTYRGASLEIGFWLLAVSIGVAVIGTILVTARRAGAHERQGEPSDPDAA